MAKILITGGAGFIGSTLADKLINLGHKIIIIDNLTSGKIEYVPPRAKFYRVDICDEKNVSYVFAEESLNAPIDYVFHLAAQIDVRISVSNPELDNAVNILGGLNILKAVYNYKVKKIIFSSTGGALYGGATEIPTPENYPTNPLSPYGIHKLTFEKYLNYYFKTFGQKYTSLRLANVYGPRQYKGGEAGVISIFIENAVNNKKSFIYGDGLQTRDFIYIDDVIMAMILAMESDFIGEMNISTGIETNLIEIISIIEKTLEKEMIKEFAPAKSGEERRSALDYRLAREILEWHPRVNILEGIKRTIDWTNKISNNSFKI